MTGIAGFYLRTQYRLDSCSDAIETHERTSRTLTNIFFISFPPQLVQQIDEIPIEQT